MEKIRSGQAFLYRENGLNSTVLDVRMKDEIIGSYLQRALTAALQRYPYMANKLVEKDGDFYLNESLISMNIGKTKNLRRLGSMSTGYHLVDITYWENIIYISFHHALCDGRGIKPFLETLIYYYCCFRFNKSFEPSGIQLAGDNLLPGETQDPVCDSLYEVDTDLLPTVNKNGFCLPENEDNCESYFRYELNINRQSFIEYMKSCKATPAILLALLVSDSIYSVHPDAAEHIVCSMAVDYRKEIGLDNTYKNCVGSLYLPYSEEIKKMDIDDQADFYRNLIAEQRQPNAIKNLLNTQIGMASKLDHLTSLEEKKQALSFFNDLCIDTYVISSLGQIQLGEWGRYVDSIHLYNSGVKGLRVNMICAGDYFTVDFLQSFQSDHIINALRKTLTDKGIEYRISEKIQFETVKDKAYITAGKQAEKYYMHYSK